MREWLKEYLGSMPGGYLVDVASALQEMNDVELAAYLKECPDGRIATRAAEWVVVEPVAEPVVKKVTTKK